jgi:hypothetical protein
MNMAYSKPLYTIYDPVVEKDQEIIGGPWCFAVDQKKAYIAFPTQKLAKRFVNLWGGTQISDVVNISELGQEHEELLDDVDHFLFITNEDDMSNLIKDLETFPYNHFLVPRYSTMCH